MANIAIRGRDSRVLHGQKPSLTRFVGAACYVTRAKIIYRVREWPAVTIVRYLDNRSSASRRSLFTDSRVISRELVFAVQRRRFAKVVRDLFLGHRFRFGAEFSPLSNRLARYPLCYTPLFLREFTGEYRFLLFSFFLFFFFWKALIRAFELDRMR